MTTTPDTTSVIIISLTDCVINSSSDLVLDIHAHTALTGLFIYGNSYDDVYRYERHIVFPKMLAQNCRDFSGQNTMYNKDPDKVGTARRHLSAVIESETTNVYSLEMSMYGYKPDKKSKKIIPYTEEHCESPGSDLIYFAPAASLFQTWSRAGIFAKLSGISTKFPATLRAGKWSWTRSCRTR